ncbi:MAG TPA: zinc ribbon domain-containing protein [Candidatus Binatia bacterium]
MPIYEYACGKCGTFEVTQRITEKPLGRCPTCKGKVKKLISNTSFQLKGTGWYVTDYARKDKSSTLAGDGAKASGEAKSDAKPAASEAKSESKEKPAAEKSAAKSGSSDSTAA